MEFEYEFIEKEKKRWLSAILFNYDNKHFVYHFLSYIENSNSRKSNTCIGQWRIKCNKLQINKL